MGVDLCLIVKNRFAQRENHATTLSIIEETVVKLNSKLNTDVFKVFQDEDNDEFTIMDSRQDGDFIDISIYNGFWMIDTGWRYHQYFNIIDDQLWLRERMYKYIPLLEASEAYVCAEYCAWNNALWKDSKMTFADWEDLCRRELGHDIEILDLNDVKNREEYYYNKDAVYLDKFEDLVRSDFQ